MKEAAEGIVRKLQQAGHTAYFAGGCVRDMVRGEEPRDYDVATDATPDKIRQLFPKTIPVGAQFGVVIVLEADHQFEVATFRSDESYADGRRPTAVQFCDPEKDALRRDFTINGLFYDPVAGKVIDFVGGREDINRKLVRCIGDPRHRFTEDKLRMLRCIRFAANLGYEIDPATFAAVQTMASEITVVSMERVRDELIKIFTRAYAGKGLELLDECGLLQVILPDVAKMKGVEQPAEFHPEGDVFTHTKLMLNSLPPNANVVLAFSVLLHDVGKPPTFERATDRIRFHEHDRVGAELAETILRDLRFSNEQIEKIVLCIAEHMRIKDVQQMRAAKLKRILARETFPEELELHRIDCVASHRNLENYEFLKAKAAELPAEVIKPAPLVTGHDLLKMGLAPGPMIGKILRAIEEQQLEERLRSREEALEYARTLATELSGGAPST